MKKQSILKVLGIQNVLETIYTMAIMREYSLKMAVVSHVLMIGFVITK